MSVRPGINIALRSTPPARPTVSDTGAWYTVGTTDAGPLTPTMIHSMGDYERIFGLRQSYSVLYDALDAFFREGGSTAFVSRVVGPAAVTATKNLLDASSGVSLVANALGPGASGNNISVGVRAGVGGGTFVVFVVIGGVEVETSPDLAAQSAAVLWGQNSQNIRIVLGASALVPAVAAAAPLAGGNDDRANIVDANWQAALDRITKDMGVGQVSAPGRVTSAGLLQVLAHAQNNFRSAVLDAPDTATITTLQTLVQSLRAGGQRFGAIFWPWLILTGVVAGTTRSVPPSAFIAARLATNDSSGLGPGAPAAGDNGLATVVLDLSQPDQTDANRQTLNTSGVNVIRRMFGGIRNYGWRTLVDPTSDPYWVNYGNSRTYMAIAGAADSIAEQFMFDKIDGQGVLFGDFNAALSAMLQNFYLSGDLFGASPSNAYFVDTGPQVNTPTTIANRELRAILNVRMSEFAEMVTITIYKQAITEP